MVLYPGFEKRDMALGWYEKVLVVCAVVEVPPAVVYRARAVETS